MRDHDVTSSFFTNFFEHGWEFAYKLVLTILNHLKQTLLEQLDFGLILQEIKFGVINENDPFNQRQRSRDSRCFPWFRYLIEENIMTKWKSQDLHNIMDLDQSPSKIEAEEEPRK